MRASCAFFVLGVGLISLMTGCSDDQPPVSVYHHTLTRGGFTVVAFQAETSRFSLVRGSPFVADGEQLPDRQPTVSLTVHPSGRFAYAAVLRPVVNRLAGVALDGKTGAVTAIPGSPLDAAQGTSSLVIDPSGRFLYAASQSDVQGTCLLAYAIDQRSGALAPLPGSPVLIDRSNCWSVAMHPSGRFLYVVDNTANAVNTAMNLRAFGVDADTGAVTLLPGSPYAGAAAANHGLAFTAVHPNGKFLYAISDPGQPDAPSFPSVIRLDPQTGAPTDVPGRLQDMDPPLDRLFFHPGGKLAIGTRQRAGMVVYRVDPDAGHIIPTQHRAATPATAATITFDPSGRFVLVGDADHDAVSVFALDAETGALGAVPGSPFTAAP
jgi:6-phosphogluconolactonase (cycloisomerase 2 family)